jgi:hypothetical protein
MFTSLVGNPAILARWPWIRGSASPPLDGFALPLTRSIVNAFTTYALPILYAPIIPDTLSLVNYSRSHFRNSKQFCEFCIDSRLINSC